MRIAVAIATTGRPSIVDQTAPRWAGQTRPYDRLVFSLVDEADLGPIARALPGAEVLTGPKGLTKQRNCILDQLGSDCDLVVFCDDDYVPSRFFLERTESAFDANPALAILTGGVVADGINTQGISFEDAVALVEDWDADPERTDLAIFPITHAYGCNMMVRVSAKPDLRFDERLPLYGWLEDLDYSRRMAPYGDILRAHFIIGVHMGFKGGRQSGVKLGYSQVANPMYFVKKGTMPKQEAMKNIIRNIAANAVKSLNPEPWVDRIGRLRGNLLALTDAIRGRQSPERINNL